MNASKLRLVSAPAVALASELNDNSQLMTKLLEGQSRIAQLIAKMERDAAAAPGLAKAATKLTQKQVEEAQERKLLAAVAGKTLWLPEAASAAGLTKQVADATARRLAYAKRLWMSLEPGPAGKLTFRLRSPERVAVE